MKKILSIIGFTLALSLGLGVTYRYGQHTAVDDLTRFDARGRFVFQDARGQAASNTPFGLSQLLSNPTLAYGTHPGKPLYASQSNIYDKPTFMFGSAFTLAVNAVFSVESGPSLRTRLRRFCVNPGTGTTSTFQTFSLQRTSTAGAGTALGNGSIAAADTQDAVYSGIIRNIGTTGTASTTLGTWTIPTQTTGTATLQVGPNLQCFNFDDGLFKSPIIGPGACPAPNCGVALQASTAAGTPVASSASFSGIITEEAY
jgi:hypothetical protein